MGRWGDELYQSDSALDYFATIADMLEREVAFQMWPEQVSNSCYWLGEVFAVIELMLLFEYHNKGSSSYLGRAETSVKRWREIFLQVWDGDWKESEHDEFPYYLASFRREHRPSVVALFERLEKLAFLWAHVEQHVGFALETLPPEYPLPYFSIIHYTREDRPFVKLARFTHDLIDHVLKDVIYLLSPEKRNEVIGFYTEDLWVAVDNLGFLCEIYEHTPGVTAEMVHGWRETTFLMEKQRMDDAGYEFDRSRSLYQSVERAFDRLELIAEQYPPEDW